MKRTKTQYQRMGRTFERVPVQQCKIAYDLNRLDGLLMINVAIEIAQTLEITDLMIDAYASHLTLDVIPVDDVAEAAKLQEAVGIEKEQPAGDHWMGRVCGDCQHFDNSCIEPVGQAACMHFADRV